MVIGRPRDTNQINADLSDLADRTRDLFQDWDTFGVAMEDLGTQGLTGEGKYTEEEVQLLNRIVIDTRLLERVFRGVEALPQARDFTYNLRRVWGFRR